jgi:hypothetical protein
LNEILTFYLVTVKTKKILILTDPSASLSKKEKNRTLLDVELDLKPHKQDSVAVELAQDLVVESAQIKMENSMSEKWKNSITNLELTLQL